MFPCAKNRDEGTFRCSPVPKIGTRAHSPKPPFHETALLFPLELSSRSLFGNLFLVLSHFLERLFGHFWVILFLFPLASPFGGIVIYVFTSTVEVRYLVFDCHFHRPPFSSHFKGKLPLPRHPCPEILKPFKFAVWGSSGLKIGAPQKLEIPTQRIQPSILGPLKKQKQHIRPLAQHSRQHSQIQWLHNARDAVAQHRA